tara:strand:+ start:2226 stop:4049 length:1824 start_codon:yes stop_codon:yes gene_type:complete
MVLEIDLKIAKFHMDLIFAIIPPELIVNWIDGGTKQTNSNPLQHVNDNSILTFHGEIGYPITFYIVDYQLPAYYDSIKLAEKGIDINKCVGTTDAGDNINYVTFNMDTTAYMINGNQTDDLNGTIYDWSVPNNNWTLIDISDGECYMGIEHGLLKLYKKIFTANINADPYIFDNRYSYYLFTKTPKLVVNWIDGGLKQTNMNPLQQVNDNSILTFDGEIGYPITFYIVNYQLPAYYDSIKLAEKGVYLSECVGITHVGQNINYVTFNMETIVYMICGNQSDDLNGSIYDWNVPNGGWTPIDISDGECYMGIEHGLLKLYKKIFVANNKCGTPYIFDNRYAFYLFAESNNPYHSQSKCCRTNILDHLHIEEHLFDKIENYVYGNSVGSVMGMQLPVDHHKRMAGMKDIMTVSSRNKLNNELDNMKINLFEDSIDKIIGVDNTKSIQINIQNDKLIRSAITNNINHKLNYKNSLCQHMAYFLSNGSFGIKNDDNFLNPTDITIDKLGDSTQTADLIEQLIIQSINACSYNTLFGAPDNNHPIVPDFIDGKKQLYFLHFNIGDSLFFKRIININNVNLTIKFNIIVTHDTDNTLNNNRGLGPILGSKMNS